MKNHITLKQKIVEILAYVLMWASIVIGIIWSAKLPKEVATHFDAAGNADGYGSPYSFLFLPIIMLISCGISSLVLHFMPPDLWSMPVKVKPEHAVRVYRDVVWMMAGIFFMALPEISLNVEPDAALSITGRLCFKKKYTNAVPISE